jgi:ATP synthase protein I
MPDTEHGSFGSIAKVAAANTDTENGDEDLQFKPLTREEAQALRARHPFVSPWVVLGVQALAGLLVSAGVWLVWQQSNAVWSALYGAAAAVIPGAVMARGMSRQASNSPGGGLTGFMFWEFAKVLTAVAMLVAAVKVVPSLHWPVLLVTMIVSLKVNWLALLWRRPSTQQQQETKQHGR